MERDKIPTERLIIRTNRVSPEVVERARKMIESSSPCTAKITVQEGNVDCKKISNVVLYWEDMFGSEYWPACDWEHIKSIEEMAVESLVRDLDYSANRLPAFAVIEKPVEFQMESVETNFAIFPHDKE